MKMRGEITVFLSLVLVCVMSLFLTLVESARTAGARLYLEMASNSAMTSVMSQYNRNLWEMYHLLFLEAESEKAVEDSFVFYVEYYLDQKNLYPMELDQVQVLEKTTMTEDGGWALEQEILSYMTYRLPDVAVNAAGITEEAAEAVKTGDFRELYNVCKKTGKNTRNLAKSQERVEACLVTLQEVVYDMESVEDDSEESTGEENDVEQDERKQEISDWIERFEDHAESLSDLVTEYENEVEDVAAYLEQLKQTDMERLTEEDVKTNLSQEIIAYEQVVSAAEDQNDIFANTLDEVFDAKEELENLTWDELDWGNVTEIVGNIDFPVLSEAKIDREKMWALDRLEELFQSDLLALVLPENTVVSKKRIMAQDLFAPEVEKRSFEKNRTMLEQFMVNEYCFLSFDSFLDRCERDLSPIDQPLQYEQEYLLCGKLSDRENLKETVEQLLTARAAMNLLYLMQSVEQKAAADSLAAAVSGGFVPVQFILSFFILTLWALGEAVWDVKNLLAGESVPFWKTAEDWKLSVDELLSLRFLDSIENDRGNNQENATDNGYQDYVRVLFFLMEKEERNGRMLDLIQWNVGTVQQDFRIADCMTNVRIQADVWEQHLFMMKNKYKRSVEAMGSY